MMLSLASIVTAKNVIPLTLLILNPNKKRFAKRISSKNVSLNTRNPLVRNPWSFVIRLWFVKEKDQQNVGLSMNLSAKQGNEN